MKTKFILFFSFVLTLTSMGAQNNLSDYSYVLVPKQFDFQNSEDQYQLNSIAKFLFNKHGFNAYFQDELPNVKRCDGLYAEVHGTPNFIWTKVYIVLKDCNGMELFRSAEGRSKLKEYSKTYNEAMRGAFESFAGLDVQQKALDVSEEKPEPKITVAETTTNNENKLEKKEIASPDNDLNLPNTRYTPFMFQGTSFVLRKTNEGFSLYKETTDAMDNGLFLQGKLQIEEGKLFYEDIQSNKFPAMFDAGGNLWVESPKGKMEFVRQ